MEFGLRRRFRELSRLMKSIKYLRSVDFSINFPHEGDTTIRLPAVNVRSLVSREGRDFVRRCRDFSRRPTSEPLMRKTVYSLIKNGHIDPTKYFIDIGSWIADNTVVWAKLLNAGGVFAVDPSRENLVFGETVAKYNNLTNVTWIKAVCSEKSNVPLKILEGDEGHASFDRMDDNKHSQYISATLDEVVPISCHKKVSLLHVDVEGFEEKVILGAKSIIYNSKPVIVFEQHISKDHFNRIVELLVLEYDYRIFMINEVLQGCSSDCRNFIAFNSSVPIPLFPPAIQHEGRSEGVWYATVGDSLVRV